ncbi:MAG: methyl-accepting chemotaxis protein [Azonexus sp.]|nr:methyl-accepting chemotaxis protein [Azonexus sp.]MDZ4313188.1 methyl-accepting chemotaxis protein [Azonexus sp.]
MGVLRELYDWNERTFWNSLTKKLMSFLLLFVIDLAYLGVYFYHKNVVADELTKAAASPELIQRIQASFDSGLTLMIGLTVLALTWNVIQILYIRYLIVRPIRTISGIFDEIAKGEGDFSRNLPTLTHDELRTLAESYNRFADKMRQIIDGVRKMTVNIAREAVVMKKYVGETAKLSSRQGEITAAVFIASNEATLAIQEVSASTELISDSTEKNLETARKSLGEMGEVVDKVRLVSEKLNRFNDTVDHLAQRSDGIRQIASLIKDIAGQTNLLALNAAIEAARAGEMGRGFAVVADEVRKLAERVNVATQDISSNIGGMIDLVHETQNENQMINKDICQTREVVERSSDQFKIMVSDFERTGGQLTQIASAMEELTATNGQVHESVTQIHGLSAEMSGKMIDSEKSSESLAVTTEGVQEMVSRFKIGRGTFDHNVDVVRGFRDAIQAALEDMTRRGVNVFDQNYRPIPGTKPQKYSVSYESTYIGECQALLDKALQNVAGGTYAVAVDTNGYLTAHNSRYSKPMTGNYENDLVGNRTCRKFEAPTELRAAKNTQSMLLQTYIRDTGELLCDMAMPIMVGGRHWGNVRVGCDSNAFLDA